MAIKRNITYNGQTLPDPDSSMSLDEVRLLYAAQYPALLNAVVVYNDPEGDVQQFELQEKDTHGKAVVKERPKAAASGKVQSATFKDNIGRKG